MRVPAHADPELVQEICESQEVGGWPECSLSWPVIILSY